MEPRKLKINLTGVSGIGKTTIAKAISEKYNIPFLSGSYSDLVPKTKDMPHRDMILQSAEEVQMQDTQVLNLRNKLFSSHDTYVSDRSYLDSAAYFINKLAHRIPECEVENFIEMCRALTGTQISHLIYIPFTTPMITEWEMEDNKKRVLNRYYQREVSMLMTFVLKDLWKYERKKFSQSHNGGWLSESGILQITHGGKEYITKVLILYTLDLDQRLHFIDKFLSDETSYSDSILGPSHK